MEVSSSKPVLATNQHFHLLLQPTVQPQHEEEHVPEGPSVTCTGGCTYVVIAYVRSPAPVNREVNFHRVQDVAVSLGVISLLPRVCLRICLSHL